MQNNRLSVPSNENQGSENFTRHDGKGSRCSVEDQSSHLGGLGTGKTDSQGVRQSGFRRTPRQDSGGQASGPGLFGLPGNGSLFRRCPESQTPFELQAKADDTAQRVGGLTFGERKARLAALLGPVVPVPASNVARSGNVPVLILTGRRKEQAAAKAAAQVELSRAEKVSVARYLESIELDEEESTAREGTTASMLAFAHASDKREAFCLDFDAHEATEAGFHFAADPLDPATIQD